jgi:hypothetical protein
MRFRTPELFLGAFLTVAVFAMGMLFSSQHSQQGKWIDAKQGAAESVQGDSDAPRGSMGMIEPTGQPKQAHGDGDTHEIYGVKPGEFLLFLATIGLWYATNRLVRDARKNSERQLRAYITVEKALIRNFPKGQSPDDLVQAYVVLKNCGQTPAYGVAASIRFGFLEFPIVTPVPTVSPPKTRTVVGPGGEIHLAQFLGAALGPAQFSALLAETHAFNAAGEVIYIDAFNERRTTTFNVFYGAIYPTNSNCVMTPAQEGNEAD